MNPNKKFSQKHYESLAAFFRYELEVATSLQAESFAKEGRAIAQQHRDSARVNTIRGLIRCLAITLKNDNEKFNEQRFFKVCGLGE